MADGSAIEWTDATWNPVTGCTKITAGCDNCYEYVMETPVLFPTKDRTFYSLIYATRSSKGVEVYRDCQHATLKAQDQVRADLQVAKRDDLFNTTDMFGGAITGSEFAGRWMAEQEAAALMAIVDKIPISPG